MTEKGLLPPPAEGDDTRAKLKRHARRLFGERGIENVSLRDIMAAAGQRHVGAIGYYFGNKDALIREILADGALLINIRRNAMLDQLEAQGAPVTVREVLEIIVRSSLGMEDDAGSESYIRFFAAFHRHNWVLFSETVGNQLDRGFRRCITHLRQLLVACPHALLNERIRFVILTLNGSLSIRELALELAGTERVQDIFGGDSWASETLLDNLLDACEGMLRQPASGPTMALLAPAIAGVAEGFEV